MKQKEHQLYKIVDIHPADDFFVNYKLTLVGLEGWIDEDDIEKDGFVKGYDICTFHFLKPVKQIGEIQNIGTVIFRAVKIEPV